MLFHREEETVASKDPMGHGSITPKVEPSNERGFNDWATSKMNGCSICAQPLIKAKIRQFLELKSKGETGRSYRELYEWLVQQMDFRGGRSTMQEHMRRCETELKEAADERRD